MNTVLEKYMMALVEVLVGCTCNAEKLFKCRCKDANIFRYKCLPIDIHDQLEEKSIWTEDTPFIENVVHIKLKHPNGVFFYNGSNSRVFGGKHHHLNDKTHWEHVMWYVNEIEEGRMKADEI